VEEALTKYSSLHIRIENAEHAQSVFEKFLSKDNVDVTLRDVFAIKMSQLREIEGKMGKDVASSSLATIEPDSYFAASYVLKFPRSYIDSNKFKIDIEVSYAETGKPERHVGGTSASVIISPQPFILTLIAIAGSLLGIVLKVATNSSINVTSNFGLDMLETLTGGLTVSAVILAIVFYNIYEFTEVGKRFNKIGVGWRGALFIGTLCGLISEQILAAVKGFIGK
jgi:hypothetical protein